MNWPITAPLCAVNRHPRASGGPEPAPGLNRGPPTGYRRRWIPAFAGMTRVGCLLRARSLFRRRGFLQLDVFPRIGIPGRHHRREHVLPFLCRDARPDHIDEGVAEYRDEIVILQDLPLDLGGQVFPFGVVCRGEILVELAVEVGHAVTILAIEAAAFDI